MSFLSSRSILLKGVVTLDTPPIKDKVDFEVVGTMQEAFSKANIDAKNIEEQAYIVLAPACASFDQFSNFEERGNKFIDLCNEELQ